MRRDASPAGDPAGRTGKSTDAHMCAHVRLPLHSLPPISSCLIIPILLDSSQVAPHRSPDLGLRTALAISRGLCLRQFAMASKVGCMQYHQAPERTGVAAPQDVPRWRARTRWAFVCTTLPSNPRLWLQIARLVLGVLVLCCAVLAAQASSGGAAAAGGGAGASTAAATALEQSPRKLLAKKYKNCNGQLDTQYYGGNAFLVFKDWRGSKHGGKNEGDCCALCKANSKCRWGNSVPGLLPTGLPTRQQPPPIKVSCCCLLPGHPCDMRMQGGG